MQWKLCVVFLIKTTYRNYIYFHVGQNTKKFIHRRLDKKKLTLNLGTRCNTCLWSNYSGFQEYSNKKYENRNNKNHLQLPKTKFLPQEMLKIAILNHQIRYTVKYFFLFACLSYAIRMSFVCQSYKSLCH